MAPISGIGGALARPMYLFDFSLLNGLFGTFIMAVLRHRIRWTWLAALAWMAVVGLLFDETSHIDAGLARFWLFSTLSTGVAALVLVRFGLLAFTTARGLGQLRDRRGLHARPGTCVLRRVPAARRGALAPRTGRLA